MHISHVRIQNYKGLKDVSVPMSSFACAIGENNAGKSSLLQGILLFIRGAKLSSAEYYDPSRDILITVTLSGVTPAVLAGLADDHRTKIAPHVKNEVIRLARRYSTDGTSQLRHIANVPKLEKLRPEKVADALAGKTGKEISETIRTFYQEVATPDAIAALKTQGAAKDLVSEYVKHLPAADLEETDVPLGTGIDNSIKHLLPEPIYIPAVKDLSDELKTKEGASFGKLLNILLDVIETDLSEAASTFENLRKKLNRIVGAGGEITDERMPKVRQIEQTIQANLQETFRNVSIELQIPPPEIKTVLSSATILADDGVKGPVEHKGDGFKRAIAFSILRSYVQLAQEADWRKPEDREKPTKDRFLFLFEEPELYLHPQAQNILFDALSIISKRHQVVVTTHSPMFFSAASTKTFIKVRKEAPAGGGKPIGTCLPVDLSNVNEKDRFQLISFETSNLAFFSRRIVLIEGDSEMILFPHLAKTLNQAWDFKSTSISLVRVSGKGSFKRYRDFFTRFGVSVAVVADLDVLIKDFDKVDPSPQAIALRSQLLQVVDRIVDAANAVQPVPPKLLKEELQKERAAALYGEIRDARAAGQTDVVAAKLDELFVFERSEPRLTVLTDDTQAEVLRLKRELLTELRNSNVFVLERGAIEAYYPDGVVGDGKPAKAQHVCTLVTTAEQVQTLSAQIAVGADTKSELEWIMEGLFRP